MQHYFTGSLVSRDMNQKGYMYSQTNSAFHVITPKGEVTTHELGDNLRLAAFGDGFTVIEEHKSGFEAVEYVYHFYDDSGKELTTYSSGAKQIYELSHIGEGTFLLRDASCQNDSANAYGYSTQCAHLYFAKSNVWHKNVLLSYPGYATVNYSYRDGIFMILDKNMKDSLDSPVLGAPIATRDGFLYARTDNRTLLCYDLKGEKKSEIANVNTSSNWYDEGIICTNQLEFLKPDGTSAFDVSFSGAKQIILPE